MKKLYYRQGFYAIFVLALALLDVNSLKAQWTDKNESENYTARHECSIVQAGNKFYVMGGRENPKTIDVYDYAANTWVQIPNSPPDEFNHFQATEYQGLIWVIGAFKTNAFPNEQPTEYVWAFDPVNQEWIQGPSIPANRRRGSTGLVVHNNKFYISGGNTIGHNGGYVSWFDEYDPATGTWTPLADAPRARDHFHAAVIGNKMYLAGGRLSGGAGGTFKPVIPEVDVYDFTTGQWSTLPAAQNLPTPRAAPAVAVLNSKLFVIGGEVQQEAVYGQEVSDALKITEQYDPATQTWTRLADLNHERHGTQAIVSGNGIFVLAGSPQLGGGNQKNMEYFGQDAPVGALSAASTLTTPNSLAIDVGSSSNFNIVISGGNVGVFVRSMEISGTGASNFQIASGALENVFLSPESSSQVNVALNGSGSGATATLTINYGASSSVAILLSDGNIEAGVINPGTQQNAEGDNVSLQIFTNGLSNNLTYSATGLPPTLNINSATGLITGTIREPGSSGGSAFLEEGGLAVIEAESENLVPGWSQSTTGGATGIIASTDSFGSQSGGTIPYEITVNTPGVYRFNWRSFFSGLDPTEENDNWLKFPNDGDVWFFGYKGTPGNEASMISNLQGSQTNVVFPFGSSRITPGENPIGTTPAGQGSNGFLKIYRSGGSSENYDWQARTSDEDPHDIYVWFVNAGTYTMQISERSAGHAIDKIALYKLDGPSYSDAQLTAAPEAQSGSGNTPGAAENSPYQVEVTVVDNNAPGSTNTTDFTWLVNNSGGPTAVASATPLTGSLPLLVNFNGGDSVDDIGITDYLWEFGDSLSSESTSANPSFTYVVEGVYTATLTVTDGDGNADTETLQITVDPGLTYTITSSSGENGTISPIGDTEVVQGANQEFTVTPAAGFFIADVLVDGNSLGAIESYIFENVVEIHTISVTFEAISHTITSASSAGGLITPLGDTNVDEGSDQEYLITANTGFSVSEVLVDGISIGAVESYVFENVTEAHIINVAFIETDYSITASAGNGGTISPEGDVLVVEGSDQSFFIVADDGFQIADVLVDGISVGNQETYVFENVTTAHTISVTFETPSYTIIASSGIGGEISPSGEIGVVNGEDQIFTMVADDGFVIADVLIDNVSIGVEESYTFANITENHIINVIFTQIGNEAPIAVATSNLNEGDAPLSVDFDGSASSDDDGIVAYSWDFGDGSPVVTGALVNHVYVDVGTYSTTLSVEDSDGIVTTDSITIIVNEIAGPGEPNTVEKGFIIYPNPASDNITLVFADTIEVQSILIFDIHGKFLQGRTPQEAQQNTGYSVNVSSLSEGLYLITAYDTNGESFQQKMLIQR